MLLTQCWIARVLIRFYCDGDDHVLSVVMVSVGIMLRC